MTPGDARTDPGSGPEHRNAGGQRVDLAELPLVGDLRPRTSGSNRRAVPRRVSGAGRRPVHLRAGERGHRGWTTLSSTEWLVQNLAKVPLRNSVLRAIHSAH